MMDRPVRHLNQVELSRRWSLSPRTLERWRWRGLGPQYLKVGGRVVYHGKPHGAVYDAALDLLSAMGRKLRATNELLRNPVTRNANLEAEESLDFGARIADKVATFGGSWTFVIIFSSVLVVWMAINAYMAQIGRAHV